MIEPCFITIEMSEDFEEAIRLGAEAGVWTVHLRSGLWGRNVEQITQTDVGYMKDILATYGVRVGVILSPFGKCNIEDADEVQRHMEILARMIELAHSFDTCLVRTFTFRRPEYEEYEPSRLDEYLPKIVETLSPAVKMAEAEDIVMCFETVGSTLARSAQEARRVVDALDSSPAVALIWEIDVAWRAGELPSQGYPYVRGYVQDVHIKANPDRLIDPVGTSSDTYEDAFRALLADGYNGFATIEHWGSAEGTLRGIQQLNSILNRIK